MTKYKLKKGWYLVGDPCYIIRDEWDKILEKTNCFNKHMGGKFTIEDAKKNKHDIVVFPTHGDGGHIGNDGFEYGVDSGTLAIIPHSYQFVTEGICIGVLQMCLRCCNVRRYEKDFYCSQSKSHITFGTLKIKKLWT